VLQTKGITDDWLVLGKQTGTEEKLTYRRTWLRGIDTEKDALILDYAWGNQGFETYWEVGQLFEGELCFYPSALPQRAIFRSCQLVEKKITVPDGHKDFQSFGETYARAVAASPGFRDFLYYWKMSSLHCTNKGSISLIKTKNNCNWIRNSKKKR
jgi:hypothetical protein